MSPSELAHIFIDGEPIDPRAEATLFDALAASGEFRAELRDLLAVRAAVQSDVSAYAPPKEVTDRLFASLGIGPAGSASANVAGRGPGWMRRLWLPFVAAIVGSALTAIVVNNRSVDPVQSHSSFSVGAIQQSPAVPPSVTNAQSSSASAGVSVPDVAGHGSHRAHNNTLSTLPTGLPRGDEVTPRQERSANVPSPTSQVSPTPVQRSASDEQQRSEVSTPINSTPAPAVVRSPAQTTAAPAPTNTPQISASQPVSERPTVQAAVSTPNASATPVVTHTETAAKTSDVQGTVPITIQKNLTECSAVAPTQSNAAVGSVPAPTVIADTSATSSSKLNPAPSEASHSGPLAAGAAMPASPALPPGYAAVVRGLLSQSIPASSVATSTGGLPSNVAAGIFRMLGAHHQVGVEIGQEPFGQQFSRQERDSFVVYKQNPTLFWGTVAYRIVASPVSMLGGMIPYAQTNLGVARVGPLARITLGFLFDIADKLDLIVGGEGAMMWYRFESAWLSTRKIGATFGAAFKF